MRIYKYIRGAIMLVAVCFCMVFPLQTPVLAGAVDDYYQRGKRHYEEGRYLAAAENLFAFMEMAGDGVDEPTRQAVRQALDYCEGEIRVAIATKRELDATGKVVEVVVETSGKADTARPTKKNKGFRMPPPQAGPKPRLPRAPKVGQPAAMHVVAKPLVVAPQTKRDDVQPLKTDKHCAALEKKVGRLEAENERLTQQAERLSMRYHQLRQRYKELAND
jgi:hypothetical protein